MRCIEKNSNKESRFQNLFDDEEMDHNIVAREIKSREGWDSTTGDRRYATKLFRGTKSAGTCINAEKMRGWRNEKWETGKGGKREKRPKREKEREVTDRRQGEARVLRQEAVIALLT